MAGLRSGGSVPSLPTPRPKSPPEYPDLYGKRRELAKIQKLEREISFLEEELKSIEGIQPASTSCKEIADFVMRAADPLIPTTNKSRRSCRLWRWLCGLPHFSFSCICCGSCSSHADVPCCCDLIKCNSCSKECSNCRLPNCHCFSCWNIRCFSNFISRRSCCFSCPACSCIQCKCYPKCPKLNFSWSCSCQNRYCYPCFFCY